MKLSSENIDKLLVALLVFIGAKGNLIAISDITLILVLFFSFYHFRKRGRKYTKKFALFTGAYALLTVVYFLKFDWVNPTSTLRVYLKLLIGYHIISVVGVVFLEYFRKLVYKLALISLPLYLIQLVAYDQLKSIIGIIESTIPALDYRGDWYVNSFFFTLNDNGMFRNSGFAWEPKGFASILDVSIILGLMQNGFKLNRSILIQLVALTTTFSTAGYLVICVAVPLLFILNIKSREKKMISIIFGSILVVMISSLDFMYDKITREIENREAHLVYIDAETNLPSVTLGRFGSLALAAKDFPKNPIVGIGMQDKERTQGKHTRLVWVSGIADFLSRFGLLGIAFLIYSYYISSKRIVSVYKMKGSGVLVITFMMIFFASAVIISPLFFAFQFFGFTHLSNINQDQK